VLRYIRREIGFAGVIVSDDLAMKALSGDPGALAAAAIAAGCDIALECPGDLARTEAVLRAVPALAPAALRRLKAARRAAAEAFVPRFDPARAAATLAELLG
jgi:beta-N-acetylhexosaminidase